MPIFKKTKCRMKWCYSPSRHKDGTCDKICTYNTVYVQTNADRIRAMTDDELAEWLKNWTIMVMEDTKTKFILDGSFVNDAIEWLKKEVEE